MKPSIVQHFQKEFTGSNCGGGECLGAGAMVVVVVDHSKS